MCYFITAILPNYADTNLLAPIFKLTNLTPSLLMKMNEDELYEFLL